MKIFFLTLYCIIFFSLYSRSATIKAFVFETTDKSKYVIVPYSKLNDLQNELNEFNLKTSNLSFKGIIHEEENDINLDDIYSRIVVIESDKIKTFFEPWNF